MSNEQEVLEQERNALLAWVEDRLELPLVLLGFAWLVLLVVDLVRGLTPLLELISTLIWLVFLLDFGLKLWLAPHRWAYMRKNWLTILALVVPALRVLRIARALAVFRAARAVRSVRLLRVITAVNRGMRALGATLQRRGFGYVVALTGLVTFAGAAGMYAFEHQNPDGQGLPDYGTALWWTAMIMTTMGSAFWPQTVEGRMLCLLLALYAFAVWGYVTATIATFFIGRDAENQDAELAGAKAVAGLSQEIQALRRELHDLLRRERPAPPETQIGP